MNRRYSGDFDFVNTHLDVRNRKDFNSSCYSCKDTLKLFRHMKDNTHRDSKVKILGNDIRENIKLVNGDFKKTEKELELLVELDKRQQEINKNHHRTKKDNVFNYGRGEKILGKFGVSQLLLNPRLKENQKALDKWEKEITRAIKEVYGEDVLISFHYNETSAGVHFFKKFYKIKNGKAEIDRELKTKYSDKHLGNKVVELRDKIDKIVREISKEEGLEFRQEAGTLKSLERDISTKRKILEKQETGQKLSYKEQQILDTFIKKNTKTKTKTEKVIEQKEVVKYLKDINKFNWKELMNYNIIWRDKLGKITRQETLGQYIGRLLDKSKDYDLLNKSLDNIGITQDKQIINRVMEYRDKFSKKQNEALLSEITQKEEELKRIKDKQQDRGTSRGGFIR